MNKTMKLLLGVLLSIVLLLVIIFEVKFGFKLLHDYHMSSADMAMSLAETDAKNKVTIKELVTYEEVPAVPADGDVIQLSGYDVKIKLNGKMTDDSMALSGKYTYSSAEDSRPLLFTMECKTHNVEEFKEALNAYWEGDSEQILKACNIVNDSGTITYYQNSFINGDVPVVHLGGNGLYYMFLLCDDSAYLILTAPEPFSLTNEKVTVHFGNPAEAPMTEHTYSDYETLATKNTLYEIVSGGESESTGFINPYDSSIQSNSTYTADVDNQIRKQMVSLANYKYNSDGTSDEIGYVVDIKSEEALKSQWVLTSTQYSYSCAGLRLSMLSGRRSAEEFVVGGNINNLIDAQRPYVIVIKYLDSSNGLLGISVIDNRESPLAANGVATFSQSINPVRDSIDVKRIASVMFEVH